MTGHEDDQLIARLRQADPVADGALPPPDRAAVTRRRARRSARRLGVGAAGVVAAAVLAVSLAPSSGSRLDRVVERAAAASAPAAGRIVAIESRVDARGSGRDGPWSRWLEKTTWVRFSASGEVLGVRTQTTGASGGGKGVEDVTERAGGRSVLRRFDPATGKVRTFPDTQQIPGVTFEAHRLLAAARDGDARVRLDGEETIDGRKAHRLVVIEWDSLPPRSKVVDERRELIIDAETNAPIAERVTGEGTAPDGSRSTDRFTQRVTRHTELPDSAENRRLLTLHGRG